MNGKNIENYFARAASAKKTLVAVSLAILFIALTTSIALGQVLYGSLNGNVTDPLGSVVAGASVKLTNNATNIVKNSVTDGSGSFQFTDLQPGTYTLSVTATTFKKTVSEGISIQANTDQRVNVHLQAASVGQTVTVTTAPPLLQTEQANVSTDLNASQLQDLPAGPANGMRNFQSLYQIVPGSTPPANAHSESGNPGDTLVVNMNGVSYTNNNTKIDGVSDAYPFLPEIAAYAPSTEAIRSVNIVTNSFDAEQGIAAGAVINVFTKSGTNSFHGTAWEYNTISALAAKNYFLPVGKVNPKYILNQFGANIGGPIARNKAFFFVNWERSRRSQAVNGFQTIAPDSIRTGNFQGTGVTIYDPSTGNADGTGRTPFQDNIIPPGRISTAAAMMAALLPAPNINTTSLSNNYFASDSAEYTRDTIDSRVDYNPSSKSTVFGRYSIQRTNLFDPQPLGAAGGNTLDGGQPGTAPSIIQPVGIGGTYAFSPTVLLDANFGYTRQGLSAENNDIGTNYGLTVLKIPGTNGTSRLYGGYPQFGMTGLSSIGNPNASNPFQFRDNIYTTAVNLTAIFGKHSTRYGLEYEHYGVNNFQPGNTYGPRGGFAFTGGLTALNGGATPNGYNSWADFLLGLPQNMGKETQFLNPSTLRESAWAVYARDQWQVMQGLTLNYGLRYELYPIGTHDHFGADIYNPDDGNVYLGGLGGVPRNAGVETGHGNLVPRVGAAYSISANTVLRAGYGVTVNPNNYKYMTLAYPAVIAQDLSGSNAYEAAGDLRTGIPPITLPDISQGVLKLPTTLQTYTYPRKFRRGYIESYNVAIEHEVAGFTLQATYVGTLAIRESVALNINAAGPGGGNTGRALYPTLGTTATITQDTPMGRANYNGLQFEATRRFKNDGMIGLSYTYSKTIANYAANSDATPAVSYLPDYSKNRGPASFDLTHNLEIYGNYMLPFGRGQEFFQDGLTGKILGGWQTNYILSITSGLPITVTASAASLNAPGNTQFANQLVRKVHILGGHDRSHPYFDPADFASVTTVAFGSSGVGSLRGPGYFNLNFGLSRTFTIANRFKLQLRGEAFNLTNTPSFNNPGSNVSSETISPSGAVNLNGYSIISSAKPARTLRLAGRFYF